MIVCRLYTDLGDGSGVLIRSTSFTMWTNFPFGTRVHLLDRLNLRDGSGGIDS